MTCDDTDRDPASREAAAVQVNLSIAALHRALVEAQSRGEAPPELVGLSAVLCQAARADLLRAVEFSRAMRRANALGRQVRHLWWALAALSGVVLLATVLAALP
jgi:hypothetical protein